MNKTGKSLHAMIFLLIIQEKRTTLQSHVLSSFFCIPKAKMLPFLWLRCIRSVSRILRFVDQFSESLIQMIRFHRFGKMRIHACLKRSLHVFIKCIGRQSSATRTRRPPDDPLMIDLFILSESDTEAFMESKDRFDFLSSGIPFRLSPISFSGTASF